MSLVPMRSSGRKIEGTPARTTYQGKRCRFHGAVEGVPQGRAYIDSLDDSKAKDMGVEERYQFAVVESEGE